MKKLLTLILTSALLLGLTLPLASCSAASRLKRMDEAERAEYFYEVVDRNMTYARSGSYEQTMILDAILNGVAYKQTSEATVTFISERNDVTYLEQGKTTVDTVGGGTVIYSDSGYADGMMFSYTKEGKNETKLKSPLSLESYSAFRSFQNAGAPLITVGTGISETMSCKENNDGTWTATYEGFTEEGMVPFLYMLRGIDYMVTAEHGISDVRMTLHTDRKLYPSSMKIEFIFEENTAVDSPVPVVTLENVYHGWNNTKLAEPYDLSDFTEVEDLRAVDVFTDALLEKSCAPSGAFDVKVVTRAQANGYDETVTSRQHVTFTGEEGFRFTYDYEDGGYDYKLAYAEGKLSVSVYENRKKVHSETSDMTEAEARGTVFQLVDPEGITARSIGHVEIMDAEQGVVRFTLSDAFKNEYKEQAELSGVEMTAFSGYCEATLAGGNLTEYRYHMEMTVNSDGETIKTTVDMTITFSDTESGGNGETV